MKAFFDIVRKHFGPLDQGQVDGMKKLIEAASGLQDRHIAYILATSWHETARMMQPIYERGSKAYFDKYEGRASLGNTVKGDGYRFRGRGHTQITGRRNYGVFSKLLGVDLLANPDLALDPAISAKIIVTGMKGGLFTGKKMADYTTFKDMRRVVNGTDKADLIAGYADKFLEAVQALKNQPVDAQTPQPAPIPAPGKVDTPGPVSEPAKPMGLLAALIALFVKLFGGK